MPICGEVNTLGDLYTQAWWTKVTQKRPDHPLAVGYVKSMGQTLYLTFPSDYFPSQMLSDDLFSSQQNNSQLFIFHFLWNQFFFLNGLKSHNWQMCPTFEPLVIFCICIFVDWVRPGEISFTFVLIFMSLTESFYCSMLYTVYV